MCCGRDRIDEPLIGIRREVHGDPRRGRNAADDLDIEHDLTVRAIRAGWPITSVVDRNGDDLRRRNVQLLKIGAQVGGTEATAKLDDSHALALTVHFCGKVVQLRNLRRCKRCAWARRTRAAAAVQLTLAAYVRPGRRSVVQAKDALDDAIELGRDIDRPLASAEGPPSGWAYSASLTPNAALTLATVPPSSTLCRAALVSTTLSPLERANPSTRAMSAGSAP